MLLQDYPQISPVKGSYDKVVSIEMFEHGGREHHETFFRSVSKLLNKRHAIAGLPNQHNS